MTLSRFGTLFLSTLSLRRATMAFCMDCQKSTYFYPRSPCGERLGLPVAGRIAHRISIHALLAESDLTNAHNSPNNQISIHALLAESDLCAFVSLFGVFLFLSTLSLRRATRNAEAVSKYMIFLSTLSLRRATFWKSYLTPQRWLFLSTLSLRRATWACRWPDE